jgi:hypothetical protein
MIALTSRKENNMKGLRNFLKVWRGMIWHNLLRRHEFVIKFDGELMYLECLECGKKTIGWNMADKETSRCESLNEDNYGIIQVRERLHSD